VLRAKVLSVRLTENEYKRLVHLLNIVCGSEVISSQNLRSLLRHYENVEESRERANERIRREFKSERHIEWEIELKRRKELQKELESFNERINDIAMRERER